ncbi:MAG: InlB B-repeat-containing protein [Bacilli bacterium]
MKRLSAKSLIALPLLSLVLTGCQTEQKGKIIFEKNGGTFTNTSFETNYLEGVSGSPIKTAFPGAAKDGYYFVGWREKDSQGNYRAITKLVNEDNEEYYYYPYGTDTLYAYFEPLATINFDLNCTDGTLVEPKLGETGDFSLTDKKLSGYINKDIASVDYLPTATCEHKSFEYWYIDYPLAKVEEAEGGIEYYTVDSSKEQGEYRFDQAFESMDSMTFVSGTDFTLHAKWEEDPTVTIHFNLDGIEDYKYQARNETLQAGICAGLEERLSVKYPTDGSGIFYNNKKLGGIFFDEELSNLAFLNNLVFDTDIDLYLKWSDKLSVTFDPNGGTINGNSQAVELTGNYYFGDVIPESVLDDYLPTKEDSTFVEYDVNGERFDFGKTTLAEDIILVAAWDINPVLTLKCDYPSDYTGTKVSDSVIKSFKSGDDITAALDSFKDKITDDSLVVLGYSYIDENNESKAYNSLLMSEDSLVLHLAIKEKAKLTVSTYSAANTQLAGVNDIVGYYADSDIISADTLSDNFKNDLTVSELTYIYDGLYSDKALTSSISQTVGSVSSLSRPTMSLYRKMTKAIKLSFKKAADSSDIGSCYVIPSSEYRKFSDRIEAVVGTGKVLKLENGTIISTILPDVDSTIYVSD